MSPGTHGKNVTGNLFFMAQNGYTSFKAYDKAFSIVKGQIKSRGETQIDSDLLKYIRLGIIDSSVIKKELMEMFNGDKEASVATLMQRRSERWFDANNTRKKVGKALQKAYQLEDDYFKIVSFEIESGRYALALFGKETSALSEEQKTEIDGGKDSERKEYSKDVSFAAVDVLIPKTRLECFLLRHFQYKRLHQIVELRVSQLYTTRQW